MLPKLKRHIPLAALAAVLMSWGISSSASRPLVPLPTADVSMEIRKQTVESLADALTNRYVFPEQAEQAAKLIKEKLTKGDYNSLTDGNEFGKRLYEDVNGVIKDAHFRIGFSATPLPKQSAPTEPTPEMIQARQKYGRRINGGFEKIERLPGNIGYLQVHSFGFPDVARDAAAGAMKFLANTDALIIDVRYNGGGSPEAVRDLCSYLFGPEPVHLNDIYSRTSNTTEEFWTLKEVPAPRYVGKDVFVLCSKRTGSAAEEFCYNLQNLKRVTLIGESTWGGANPGGNVRLSDHYQAFVSTGRAINPITKTNWEGTGVKPDVDCPQDQALKKAQELALEKLLAKETDASMKSNLQRALDELRKPASSTT